MARPSPNSMFDPEVVEELRRQFQEADKDGDGEIDSAEACVHFARCCSPNASPEEVRRTAEGLRHQLDSDRSGTISFDEYCFRFGRKYQMERNRLRRAEQSGAELLRGNRSDGEQERDRLEKERAALELEKERETLRREREAFERERQAFRQAGPAPSAPPRASEPPAPLVPGVRVLLHGLQGAADLNNKTGVIRRFDDTAGRYVVELDGGAGQKSLKAENLRPCVPGSAAAGGAPRGGSVILESAAQMLSRAQDFAKRAYFQVQMWLAGYETWQILLGIALFVLFVMTYFQVSSRYPGGSSPSRSAGDRAARPSAGGQRFDAGAGARYDEGAEPPRGAPRFNTDYMDSDGYDDHDDGYRSSGGRSGSYGSGGGGGGGGLLGMLGAGGPMQWYLVVGGLGFLCWKGIIPIHKMSWFQIYMLWNLVEPMLMGGRRGGGLGRRRRGFF